MKVLVISGFLGAGKTTFLQQLSRRTKRDFAVMENEYGPVGVDGAVLGQGEAADRMRIFELTEGCICCSMKSDFATSVLTIANTVDPEYLIVEPTGVGMLSQVLQNLSQIQYDKIRLLAPVTVLDGLTFERYRQEYPDILTDQLAAASTVVVSKMEQASPEELAHLTRQIREIAPDAEILTEHYSHQSDAWWDSLLHRGLNGALPESKDSEAQPETLGLTDCTLHSPYELVLLLNAVVAGVFGDICRAKGLLQAGGSWLRFDVAGDRYSITGCEPVEDAKAVFIGTGLRRSWLREVLQQELRVTIGKKTGTSGRRSR